MGPIGENEINILIFVNVPDMASFPFFYKGRSPSYGLKSSDRTADSPGKQLAAFAKQFIRFAQETLLVFEGMEINVKICTAEAEKVFVSDELMNLNENGIKTDNSDLRRR
jgi:hypothetical protein